MKIYFRILAALTILSSLVACIDEADVEFALDTDTIEIGPEGGSRLLKVSSSESWTASTQQPWITVSPANGRGSANCRVIIDSTLLRADEKPREGTVFINGETESRSFKIIQSGFDYQIVLDRKEVNVPDFAEYSKRSFEVKIKTNVTEFEIQVPDSMTTSLKPSVTKVTAPLDRGARPREVTVKFEWQVSSKPWERLAGVKFKPVDNIQIAPALHDTLAFCQGAAPKIVEGTVEGDSLALLGINRSLGVWTEFDTSEKMEHWTGIEVWKTKDKRNGRVKSASFAAFTTKEGLPYEVQFLTAAEELSFYGNTNTFLLNDLDCGEYICMLGDNLKRLTIGAYGLTSLHEDFSKLKNLTYLNLEANNFQKIPEVINENTFPELNALMLNGNIRYTVSDLSNEIRENIGGFVEEEKFPIELLAWNKLDTLRLSANYLQGTLPTDQEMIDYLTSLGRSPEYWVVGKPKEPDEYGICIRDSLAVENPSDFFQQTENQNIPKVLPRATFFAINLNRLTGELPKWLLYHPKLDLWFPDLLVWSQEGKDKAGNLAMFSNAPTNMQEYYKIYDRKKYNPKNYSEEDAE